MLKAYKYRIYPTIEQQNSFAKHFGCARHVYNWALELKQNTYKETGKSISKRELQNRLLVLKQTEKAWLKEVNSQSLLAALFNLDTAYQNFFQGRSGLPKFKKKYDGHQSYQCPQHGMVDFAKSFLHLPKIKNIKTKLHRSFEGKIKTITVSKVPTGKYYASILVETKEAVPLSTIIEADKTLGLDMGLNHYVIDSQGNKQENPRYLRSGLTKLANIQKQFSRKKNKTSKNRVKQKTKVAKIHEKITNQRKDFAHQLSAKLVFKNHETSFAIEDLHIKGMIKNRKLSRAIADSGWRTFIQALAYKCEWSGKNLLKIDRFAPSSKTCHVCKVRKKELPLQIREWQCECGVLHDRDINAARNIKTFALADALGPSVCVKQFPYS